MTRKIGFSPRLPRNSSISLIYVNSPCVNLKSDVTSRLRQADALLYETTKGTKSSAIHTATRILKMGFSMMNTDTMTIRQMCDAFDVTPRTLRFYEAKELLFPIREGQKRLFTKRDRARLKLILRGKRFGFSLEEIRQ